MTDISLIPPQSVVDDPDAVEILRIWWSHNEPAMAVKPAFQDPAAVGAMLAHAASHMAYAYAKRGAMTEEEAHLAILKGFRATVAGAPIRTEEEVAAGAKTQ